MNFPEKLKTHQCRTCYNATKGLKLLTDLTKCSGSQEISYAELLADVSHINIMEDFYNELPQFICEVCSRKLKAAQAFIQQAHEVNERLLAMLSAQKDQQDNQFSDNQYNDDAQEIPVQVKMEFDDSVVAESEPEVQWQATLKEEETDGFPQSELNGRRKDSATDDSELPVFKGPSETNPGIYIIKNVNSEADTSINQLKPQKYLLKNYDENDNESDEDNQSDDSKEDNHNNKRKSRNTGEIVPRSNDDDIAVPCSQCDKIFSNSKALALHQRNSHVPEDQKCTCPVCFRKFTRACSMYTHMRTFHGPDTVPFIRKPLTEERIFQCTKCPKNYTQKKYLDVHIKTKHCQEIEEKKKTDGVKTTNDETFAKPSNRPLCSICGSSFPNKTHLTVHMRRHTGERPFKCDLCERAFPRLVELTYHRRIHTGEKPFDCKICGKAFRVSSKMTTHMRSHTDIRPYKCSQCERSFKYSKDLNIHFRTHTGERPYCCNVCGSTFTQSNSLKAHQTKLGHMKNVLENATI